MRLRRLFIVGLVVSVFAALGVGISSAAYLHEPHQGTDREGSCAWHFVHNQAPNGSEPAWLHVFFDGDADQAERSTKVQANGKNQHWTVFTTGDVTLVTAKSTVDEKGESQLPGKLVLSDVSCRSASTTSTSTPTTSSTPTDTTATTSTTASTLPTDTSVTTSSTTTTRVPGDTLATTSTTSTAPPRCET